MGDNGQHLVALPAFVLIGGDHHGQLTRLPVRGVEDQGEHVLQPGVGLAEAAVVGVVAQVGNQPAHVGQITGDHVCRGNDPTDAVPDGTSKASQFCRDVALVK